MLENPLLDLLAKECDSDGASVEGSQHSEDDKCVLLTKNRTLLKRIIIIPIFSIKSFHSKAVKIVVINEVLLN
jgi:hypothetical protein